jgi:hypothetical protein
VALSPVEKRIIDLSSKIVSTDDPEEFNRIASELKSALHEHAEALRRMIYVAKQRLGAPMVAATSESQTKQVE